MLLCYYKEDHSLQPFLQQHNITIYVYETYNKKPKDTTSPSPFADNIYHFWRLSKKYPHLFFHPLENQGKWEENAWSYDVADCIDKLKNALRTSLKTPPKRPCRHPQGQKNLVLTSATRAHFGSMRPPANSFHRAFCSKFPLHRKA